MTMAVNEMLKRKVTNIGNSKGTTLPQEVIEHLNLNKGDEIRFILEDDGKVFLKKHEPVNYDAIEGIDQEFIDGVKDLIENYNTTLQNLKDR
uniref:AbrB/MazE/SpoVT family DNA-binding domain-containing protein n=1 Tax=uncultured Allobacillus sp. TaxID=1638025 RepID=UPI002594E784|nr:AbrB/MazE/SpoVT family DNA-binding domain-containing protein [uncultured Allobacillus sp.]